MSLLVVAAIVVAGLVVIWFTVGRSELRQRKLEREQERAVASVPVGNEAIWQAWVKEQQEARDQR